MFYAVSKNGTVEENEQFEMLSQKDDILFYAHSEYTLLHTNYHVLNRDGARESLVVKGCSLTGVISGGSEICPYVELVFEMPDKSVERLKVWRVEWEGILPLSAVAKIIEQINECGCGIYFAYCKLKAENKALRAKIEVLETNCNALGMQIMDFEKYIAEVDSYLKK